MYTFTKYDMQGNVIETKQYSETIPAPMLAEYPNLDAQLTAEEWDLRDATDFVTEYPHNNHSAIALAVVRSFHP